MLNLSVFGSRQAALCTLAASTIALASACDTDQPARSDVIVDGQAGALHVDEGGAGGLPVVFVHAFGGNTTHFTEQLAHLRAEREAIAIDLRGHGRSAAPADDDYRVESLASDIEAAVDALILERFVLVGHSMGGSAAVAYAEANPERVAGLVLVGSPGKMDPGMAAQVLASLQSDYTTGMTQYMQSLLTGATPEVAARVRSDFERVPRNASLAIIAANFAYDPLSALQNYAGPVLLIDTDHGEGPSALHTQLPALAREVMTGTSHWPQLDRPKEFDAILDRFIAQTEAAGRKQP